MIDWNRVRQLRFELGEAEAATLAQDFLAEMAERLEHLDQTPGAVALDLYHLRGASLNLGFAKLAARCLAYEMQLWHGDPQPVDQSVLSGLFDATKAEFLAGLPQVLAEGTADAPAR